MNPEPLIDSATSFRIAMQLMFVCWIALVILIVRRTVARGSIGLPTALAVTMTFLYGGCFVYAIPGYTHLRPDGHWLLKAYNFTEPMMLQATFLSLIGLLGFAIGCGVLRRTTNSRPRHVSSLTLPEDRARSVLLALGLVGVTSFGLHYIQIRFPMSDALLEAGRNMAVVAISLGAFIASYKGRSLTPWLAVASLVPFYYVVAFGFTSYGFLFCAVLFAFWYAQLYKRTPNSNWARTSLWTAGLTYLLLNAFIGWFTFRDEVRDIVWRGSEGSLIDIAKRAFVEVDLLTPWNFHSLDLINIRLNLNIFIARMIEHYNAHPELQQYGATLAELPLAIVPRFLWPDKPTRGGSDFMKEQTGMILSDSASYGTGLVIEFFINFRYVGVFVGFLLLGWLITRVDRLSAHHLRAGHFWVFALLFLIGIITIDPLLRPFFMVSGAFAAWLLVTAVRLLWPQKVGGRLRIT